MINSFNMNLHFKDINNVRGQTIAEKIERLRSCFEIIKIRFLTYHAPLLEAL